MINVVSNCKNFKANMHNGFLIKLIYRQQLFLLIKNLLRVGEKRLVKQKYLVRDVLLSVNKALP